MTLMPIITDRMVVQFRRAGKRGASYRPASGRRPAAGAQRVALQGSLFCAVVGKPCQGPNGAVGICESDHVCRQDPFQGGHELPPPRFG